MEESLLDGGANLSEVKHGEEKGRERRKEGKKWREIFQHPTSEHKREHEDQGGHQQKGDPRLEESGKATRIRRKGNKNEKNTHEEKTSRSAEKVRNMNQETPGLR